jgi:hypothetical protein
MTKVYDYKKELFRGNAFRLPIRLKQANGRPVDLTGFTINFVIGPYDQNDLGVTVSTLAEAGSVDIVVSQELMATIESEYIEFKFGFNGDTYIFGRLDMRRSEVK